MKRNAFFSITLAVAIALLSGCVSRQSEQLQHWANAEQSRQARLDTLASGCTTDLCLVMVAQETNRGGIAMPRAQAHPVWSLLDRTISIAVPAYVGLRQSQSWSDALVGVTGSITAMERAYTDNSVSIGGDQIGGNRVDDSSSTVHVGGDQISGTLTNDSSAYIGGDSVGGDQWHGDQYSDVCVGDGCASNSPGPVDNSNTGNSSEIQPAF